MKLKAKHNAIDGNQRANELVRKGCKTPFAGPEPAFGINKAVAVRTT